MAINEGSVNSITGRVYQYAYFQWFRSDGPLKNAPDVAIPLRDRSIYRSGGILPWLFSGGAHNAPLKGVGAGPRTGYGRTLPFVYKGLLATQVLSKTSRPVDTDYFWAFKGLPNSDPLDDPGRFGFLKLRPFERNGVGEKAMQEVGHTIPTTHGAINRWNGVTSARAL